jgi:general secretion pathway protein J
MNARGFTLIELLIAVTLLAAMAALLFGGVRAGLDGAGRLERRLEAVDDLRVAQSVLRRFLTAAQPLARVPGGRVIAFDGRDDGVDFVAALPSTLGGGLAQFRLQLDRTGRLLLLRAPLGDVGTSFAFSGAETSLLLDKVKAITLDYFGVGRDGKPGWFKGWQETDALPQLIRLRVASASPIAWPELTIAPRIERGER